ncbi:MAG: hypothetical protein KBS75_09285 [Bacteroidales bacterium]|nr:hypothetical protein [Candidatus Equimonas faecalis]
MTKHQKDKIARKNAAKDAGRRTYTAAEIDRIRSDIRKQEAEANARLKAEADALEEKWAAWTDYYNRYTIPRLCVGFMWAALKIVRKYIAKPFVDQFIDELGVTMQEVIDRCGETNCEAFDEYKADLERLGYETPVWASVDEWEEQKNGI